MKFKQTVFERLLFPLHKQAYRQIQEIFDGVDQLHPGQLQRIIDGFGKAATSDTQTYTWIPGKAVYVGITKRTWQERYKQHSRDAGRGSNLLFHRALRGEFCQIGAIEHIVERAGLTENQALEIEEKEVEKRSLHSLYPNGLNMIPGGLAGRKRHRHGAA